MLLWLIAVHPYFVHGYDKTQEFDRIVVVRSEHIKSKPLSHVVWRWFPLFQAVPISAGPAKYREFFQLFWVQGLDIDVQYFWRRL